MNEIMTDRELAFNTIYSIFFENRLCHEALKEALDQADAVFSGANRQKNGQTINKAWVARLVNGVTEHWLTLEYAVTDQAARKAEKIKPKLRVILYMAVYQAYYMHIPESAAVNEAVKLCKKHGLSGLSGFVNGVLRGLFRNIEKETEAVKSGKVRSENVTDKEKNLENISKKTIFIDYINEKCRNLEKPARLEIIYSIPRFILEIYLESMSMEKLQKMLEELDEGEKPLTVYRLKSRCGRQEFEESLKNDGIVFEAVDTEKNDLDKPEIEGNNPEKNFLDAAYRLKMNARDNNQENVLQGLQRNVAKDQRIVLPDSKGKVPTDNQKKRIRSVSDLSAWKKGWFIVQDYSSMLASELVPVENVNKVLDVCAAPGGKTIHLADRILAHKNEPLNTIDITACDISEKKTAKIRENLRRTGFGFIKTAVKDASVFCKEFEEGFDAVVADLPCSGLGVIGRKPDIKYKTKKEDIEALAQIQRKILSNVASYVKKGGILAYSTCTVSKSENEDNAEYIKGLGFELLTERKLLPGKENDGFFISIFRRLTGKVSMVCLF